MIFGFVFMQLACIGQIGLGGILMWDHVSLNDLVENSFWKPAGALICIGLLSLLVCWLGWNSTRKKKKCNLMMVINRNLFINLVIILIFLALQFFTLLFLFGCVQIYVCYWAHILRQSLLKSGSANFEISLDNTFVQFFPKYIHQSDHIWHRVQEEVSRSYFAIRIN